MPADTQRFDAEAAAWDANAKHVESTAKAFEAIRKYVPGFEGGARDLDVLEIGCGTGLLSFQLAPHTRSLIGVDTSSGMLHAFNLKASALPNASSANLLAVNVLVEDADDVHLQQAAAELARRRSQEGGGEREAKGGYRFDLVVSHLTLHHIPSMPGIFKTLFQCLRPGGRIAVTDYEDFGPEAIKFHPVAKREGVERHGIKKTEVAEAMREAGFCDVSVEVPYSLRKEVEAEDGEPEKEMEFPFLIMLGRRPER